MKKTELAAFCDRHDLDGMFYVSEAVKPTIEPDLILVGFRNAFQTAGDEMVY